VNSLKAKLLQESLGKQSAMQANHLATEGKSKVAEAYDRPRARKKKSGSRTAAEL